MILLQKKKHYSELIQSGNSLQLKLYIQDYVRRELIFVKIKGQDGGFTDVDRGFKLDDYTLSIILIADDQTVGKIIDGCSLTIIYSVVLHSLYMVQPITSVFAGFEISKSLHRMYSLSTHLHT